MWDTIDGNNHPINHLKKLMIRYVQRAKRPNIKFEDWDDFLSKFPPSVSIEKNIRNESPVKEPSKIPKISTTHGQEK